MPILPQTFDAAFYRGRNPDLAAMDDGQLHAHWRLHGRDEGRVASPLASREHLVAHLATLPSVLEIGPFCNPLLTGGNIEYLDVMDAETLRARAAAIGIDASRCPERIHHVGDLEAVDRRYAAVVGSHSIEHQPDLVRHLVEVERLLLPGGAYYIIVPDKRFCFDATLNESSIADILDAHDQGRRVHSLASVIEHVALGTHNDAGRHWAGDSADPHLWERLERTARAMQLHREAKGGYIDVHAWKFTPRVFAEAVRLLEGLGLIRLSLARLFDPLVNRNEFIAVLRRRSDLPAVTILRAGDAGRDGDMLATTRPNVEGYARRHGHAYRESLSHGRDGRRTLATLVDERYRGWVALLDADSHVADPSFDLADHLAERQGRAAILLRDAGRDGPWAVEDGIAFLNCDHVGGRRLAAAWATGEDLSALLSGDPALAADVEIADPGFAGTPGAHVLRRLPRDDAAGLAPVAGEVARIARDDAVDPVRIGRAGSPPPPPAPPVRSDRWSWRLAHPAGGQPGLAGAPDAAIRPATAERALATWRAADRAGEEETAWTAMLDAGDAAAIATTIATLGRTPLGDAMLGGARQHERAASPVFAAQLARLTHDRLVSLAEAIGALSAESPEIGRWDLNARIDDRGLFDTVERALDADLAPPDAIGGHLGVAVRDGIVLHPRMIDAIHAAWSLRESGAGSVVEAGGGAGLTAHYARRLRFDLRIVDDPAARAVQAAVLGEEATLPVDRLPAATTLFNADSLPGWPRERALALLAAARAAGIARFVSINHEATLPGVTPIAALMAEAGGWRRIARHRHWLRAGHVEEVWITA